MSTTTVTGATYQSVLLATESITYITGAKPATIVHSETSLGPSQLSGSSNPPIQNVSAFVQALSGGGATIDLYGGLYDGGGNLITPTGMSVRALKFQNNSNQSAVAVTPGGSNPYPLTVTVPPWSEVTVYDTGAGAAAVAGLTGSTSGTSNGAWVGSTTKTLTPSLSPGWVAHQLQGYVVLINGLAFTVSDNTTTVITTTANNSLTNGTYTWSILPAANVPITSTCRNLTLTGFGAQAINVTAWLG